MTPPIGNQSLAFGNRTVPSGNWSMSGGNETITSGNWSDQVGTKVEKVPAFTCVCVNGWSGSLCDEGKRSLQFNPVQFRSFKTNSVRLSSIHFGQVLVNKFQFRTLSLFCSILSLIILLLLILSFTLFVKPYIWSDPIISLRVTTVGFQSLFAFLQLT